MHKVLSTALAACFALALIAVGCSSLPGASLQPTEAPAATSSAAPTSTPTPSLSAPTAAPTSTPVASPDEAFYLRGWYTQSIPPQYTFPWLPPVTIADGTYLNGNVAVPAIFPGPLLILPVARSISDAGISMIEEDAGELGLLEGSGDFTGGNPKPGAKLAQIEIVLDGVKHELTGDPSLNVVCDRGRCTAEPGTPEAFTAFWNELNMLDLWLDSELGDSQQYVPERVALMLTDPGDTSSMSPAPVLVDWPLDTPLDGATCLTLSGDDLTTMLPILQAGNSLTMFSDGHVIRQPMVRPLVPGEPSPCDASQ